jgi:hypothetical protein
MWLMILGGLCLIDLLIVENMRLTMPTNKKKNPGTFLTRKSDGWKWNFPPGWVLE